MKKHFLRFSLLFFALATCLASCLKDEGTAVDYSFQSIPDINTFMPHTLLTTMGDNNLHYGDEPPRISGTFFADSLRIVDTFFVNHSLSQHSVNIGPQSYKAYFNLYEQHKGILKCDYSSPRNIYGYELIEFSREDSTYLKFGNSAYPLLNSAVKPDYFNSEKINLDNFQHAYMMGNDNYFTLYYYEVLVNYLDPTAPFSITNFYPVVANIISGKCNTRQVIEYDSLQSPIDTITESYIEEFRWGKEVIGYFNDGSSLQQIINLGRQPSPGDSWFLDNSGYPVYPKPYNGDFYIHN